MLLKSGSDLSSTLAGFINDATDLAIYVPYVKLVTIQRLLETTQSCKMLVVRWQINDLLSGASDIEVYQFCKDRNIHLFRNPRLHLKAFVSDSSKCFLTSANISSRALGVPPSANPNFEIGTIVNNLTLSDRLYFESIICESTLVTDQFYSQLTQRLETLEPRPIVDDDFELDLSYIEKQFLLSSLPMSSSVEILFMAYTDPGACDKETLDCAVHDLALYNLPIGLSSHDFRVKLKTSFFGHPFIKAFLKRLSEHNEIYFGAAKEFIHTLHVGTGPSSIEIDRKYPNSIWLDC